MLAVDDNLVAAGERSRCLRVCSHRRREGVVIKIDMARKRVAAVCIELDERRFCCTAPCSKRADDVLGSTLDADERSTAAGRVVVSTYPARDDRAEGGIQVVAMTFVVGGLAVGDFRLPAACDADTVTPAGVHRTR